MVRVKFYLKVDDATKTKLLISKWIDMILRTSQ